MSINKNSHEGASKNATIIIQYISPKKEDSLINKCQIYNKRMRRFKSCLEEMKAVIKVNIQVKRNF